ncbi:MAG TPA: DUF2807 domain-containing protein [Rhizomicrobium sp.]|nr:DUF2807 domain-containing protein [Rhizomicrobium sp.]
MTPNLRSLLCGAAVAAFVIAPTVSGYSQTAASPAQAAAPAPPAPPAPPHHGGSWAVAPIRTFNTTSVKLEDIVGTITVAVRDGGPMVVEVSGNPSRVGRVRTSQDGSLLVVEGESDEEDNRSVWDWRNWFDFSHDVNWDHGNLFVKVTVPRGTDVDVKDLVGNASIGDTMGNLRFDAAASHAHIGRVQQASIDLGGTGDIDIAGVQNQLRLDMGGSGKVTTGPVGSVRADIAGSGDAHFGAIAGGLSLDIAGSGDVTAAHVNGPTHIDIAGSGSVRILDGIANPLHVDIMGAGNLYFGGVAVDPHIDAVGSGSVHIKAYRGKLDSEGMADVKIGD